jgi:hypothetical protein
MRRIAEFVGQELKWEQPKAVKMEYLLQSGEERVAALHFRSTWGSFAHAECADGCWTFKRVGFFQTRVSVRVCNAEDEIATFRNNTWTGGGTLELPDGRRYPANTNFWMTRFAFTTETGQELIRYTKIGGFLHMSARVMILPGATLVPELPWMTLLGWYLTIMLHQDAAAAAAAAA